MIIVSDTSPINYLILIGEVHVLKELFGHIIIPEAVFNELHHPRTPQQVRSWIDSAPSWLEVKQSSTPRHASVGQLGAGECEAITVASELNADAILMDDKKATKEAQKRNLAAIGTLAILAKASKKGLVDLEDALDRLRNTNFRFPSEMVVQGFLEGRAP